MAEFPCRTRTISGTRYRVAIYSTANSELCMSTSFETEESLDRYRKAMGSKYRFEVTPVNWTEEVCIECGRES